MYPSRFAYHRAANLEEALNLLTRFGEDMKILAGGQSLLPLMKLRLTSPSHLLDIGRLSGLAGIQFTERALLIGSLTRHVDLERTTMPRGLEILNETARVIADPQVRNLGTIGGALAEVDPAGDWAAALLALETSVVCKSNGNDRVVPLPEFFVDAYTSALAPQEILTNVTIGLPPKYSGGAYVKFERKAGDFAIASAAVVVHAGVNGQLQNVGIGLGGVGLTPVKAIATEQVLKGQEFSDDLTARAATTLADEINPLADLRGSSDYKREVAQVLFKRALTAACVRARSNVQREG
jgi:aerobic carbon-monoxide dehydrogenase medium subunit